MFTIVASYIPMALFIMVVVFAAIACLVPLFWKKDHCIDCGCRLDEDELPKDLCSDCEMAENYDGPEDF